MQRGPGEGRWRAAAAYAPASILWCLAALAVKPFFAYVDFGAFYSTAIERILGGSPLDLYGFVARPPDSGLALPLTNPPIWFFFLSPWYALGRALGIADFHRQAGVSLGQAWMLVATLPLDVLLCRAVLRLAEGTERMAEPRRLALFLCLLLSPLLWLSSVRFGHNESAMILMVLMAVAAGERGRHGVSGVFWGLALGVKTTAVVPALAWFGWGLGPGRRRATLKTALVAAPIFIGPLLPYLLLRREQVLYALAGFERIRPVSGYVLWKLFPDPGGAASAANVLILTLAAIIGLILSRAPGRSFLGSGGAWALVLGQLLLLLFGKGLFVWYALGASVFLYLADARGTRPRGIVPVMPLVMTMLFWLMLGGGWIGDRVSAGIRAWSAVWVTLVVGAAVHAGRRMLGEGGRAGGQGAPI